ncbi:MAG: class I SAM-dependent methyltransferase [Candidatus Margulisbacteria bacterium]|nr:class I SAM-dependent methyltransferase [Candidatus Margulisiibacteriota bacterium]
MKEDIYVFFHIATIGKFYQEIVDEIFEHIQASGLINDCTKIFLGIVGEGDIRLSTDPKISVIYNSPNYFDYELKTMSYLDDFAKSYEGKCKILYIHTKGVSSGTFINETRIKMLNCVVDNYKDCINKLGKYDMVGAYLSFGKTPHFSGNFWWVNVSHVKSLKPFKEYLKKYNFWYQIYLNKRYAAEFWPLSNKNPRAYGCIQNIQTDRQSLFFRIKDKTKRYAYNLLALLFPKRILKIKENKWNYNYYGNARLDLIQYVPKDVVNVLELGCGEGDTLKKIKEIYPNVSTTGIEIYDKAAKIAFGVADRIIEGDIEGITLDLKDNSSDVIICGDVIEHLKDPWLVLQKFSQVLCDEGVLIASIPNVGHLGPVLKILTNRYELQESGIFDRTHLRYYTKRVIVNLFKESSYSIDKLIPIYSNSWKSKLLVILSFGLLKRFLICSFIVVAKKSNVPEL